MQLHHSDFFSEFRIQKKKKDVPTFFSPSGPNPPLYYHHHHSVDTQLSSID